MNILKGSAVLKLTALLAAGMTYYYIHNEITTQERQKLSEDPSYKLIKLTAKSLPVRVRLETVPPPGYRVLLEEIKTSPTQVTVIGPEALLETTQSADTAIVDVSENTKTVVKRLPIESVAGIHVGGQSTTVEVTIPIEKLPEPKPEPEPSPVTASPVT